MKVVLAADHAGYEVKDELKKWLKKEFSIYEILDVGTHGSESVHYPDYALEACKKVLAEEQTRGILICGTGIGMSMMANRFQGIRAALCHTPDDGRICKEHNNANILCLGGRTSSINDMKLIIKEWMTATFAGGRHEERIKKLDEWGSSLSG